MGTKAQTPGETEPVETPEEIWQRDETPMSVPMHATAPVHTHELPSRVAVMRMYMFDSTQYDHISGANLRRKRMVIIGDSGFWVSTSSSSGSGIRWPSGVPLELHHADPVWAKAAAGDVVNLSVVEENWAD